jgi:hypothetical protein
VIWIVCQHLCTEPTEGVWKCYFGKVTEVTSQWGLTMAQGGIMGILKGKMRGVEIRSASKSSLYLMPAGWLALELSTDLPWRENWCTAPQEGCFLKALRFAT